MEKLIWAQTQRLYLKYITQDDWEDISQILKSKNVEKAWGKSFSGKEISDWVQKCSGSYKNSPAGYFLLVEKKSNTAIGQVSLSDDTIDGQIHHEIGYILKEEHTKRGYATEAARYMANYAFKNLGLKKVIFEIMPDNLSSIRVAKRLGAKETGSFMKCIFAKNVEHLIYSLEKSNARFK